jgi:hypothetical protein
VGQPTSLGDTELLAVDAERARSRVLVDEIEAAMAQTSAD